MAVKMLSDQSFYTLSKTASALYFQILIATYISILLTKTTSRAEHHHDVEPGGLFCYMYITSIIYLLSLFCYFSKSPHSQHNTRSHGSAFLRQGAMVFGLGSMIYTVLEFATSVVSVDMLGSDCHKPIHKINSFLLLVFIALQMTLVIVYPRLNIRLEYGITHFGLMHLLATNAIIWIRTIIKESVLEFHEVSEHEELMPELHEVEHVHSPEGDIETSENIHVHSGRFAELIGQGDAETGYNCYWELQNNHEQLYNILERSTPILFPFIIEFSLIGCTMFYSMWNHVNHSQESPNNYKINVGNYVKSLDWSNSNRGIIFGISIVVINIINLALFIGYSSEEGSLDELISKVTNTFVNTAGLVASITALMKIQKLQDKEPESTVDTILLYFSGFFLIVYSILEILVGTNASSQEEHISSGIQALNGIMSVLSTMAQMIFLNMLMTKGVFGQRDESKPGKSSSSEIYSGRQETAFLTLLNFSQWLIFTFELQKGMASRTEAEYFGEFTWVLIQRITLPLSVFFRFHSTVILIDAWKNNYKANEAQ